MKKSFALLMAAILLISMAAGAAYAKYVTKKPLGGTVTITANLGKIELKEHLAERQPDGSYELKSGETDKNTYILLPGLDVKKDPFVRITEKTPIKTYIYVEVVSALDGSAVTFEVDEYDAVNNKDGKWIKADGATPKYGGVVYVYTGGGPTALAVDHNTKNLSQIYILKENIVKVGQKLNSQNKTDLGLDFYAAMYEVASGTNVANVYNNNPKNSNP